MNRLATIVMVLLLTSAAVASRETVLDRKVHTCEKIVDVPMVTPLCDSIGGLTRSKIDVGSCNMYCEREGKGTPVVLVSGGPGCTHHVFHPHFSRAAEYANVIYYDQRGVGQSGQDPTGEAYTLRQAVEDLDALRRELGIKKWFVLGHSYGGLLAQCYALEHPDRVLGLILVTSSLGMPAVALDQTRQYDYTTKEERAQISSVYRDDKLSAEQQVYNAHLNGDWKRQSFYRPTDDELARMALYEWKPGPGFRDRIGPTAERIGLEGRFTGFGIPTLILEGRYDLTWNADKPGKLLANHPGAKLIMFERSGHSPYADEPAKFFATLQGFLESAKAAPAPGVGHVGKGVPWSTPLMEEIDALPATNAKRASELLVQAQRMGLSDRVCWYKLAIVLLRTGDYAHSIEAYKRLAELAKGNAQLRCVALVGKGINMDLMGRRQDAITAYREALGVNSSNKVIPLWGNSFDRKWVEGLLVSPYEPK